MVSVRELLCRPTQMRSTEQLVAEGCLIVTTQLTVLFPSEDDQVSGIILSTPGLIEDWMRKVPALAGSQVIFFGKAKVYAKFGASGIQPLPLVALDLKKIEYIDQHGCEAVYEPAQERQSGL